MRSPIPAVVLVCAILLGGWGCSTKTKTLAVRSECPSLDAGDYYFPKGALDPSRPKIDRLTRDWYSQFLRVMLEPSLSCGQGSGGFAYRFLWLRGSHHPIAVRIEGGGSSITLSAVELDGAGGHAPGEIVKRIQRALSPAEQSKFLTTLSRVGFWEMPKNQDRFGLNGAQWVLEGAADGRYQVVERFSPGPGAYRDLGLLLIEFTGIAIPPLDYY
ncbi:MAG: hypothetical protein NTZ17_11790 [Phycisphaerae bacterium]|nr:hypothetical protein [Phycisphaerae bacterium]